MEKNPKKQEDLKKFSCVKCNFSTNHKPCLNVHIAAVHERKKPHKCNICGFSSARSHYLKVHIENHAKKEQLNFSCPKCAFTTKTKSKLNAHIGHVHDKKKLYSCQVCDYSCVKKHHLTDHVLAVHEKVEKYKCLKCNKGFFSERNFDRHKTSKAHKNMKVIY